MFELRVALRYLTARRKQAFISVISGISILGVAVGVMAVLIALGLMTGLQSEVRSRILGATAHVSIFRSRTNAIEEYAEVAARLRSQPHVLGTAPAVYGKGLISSGGGSAVATLKGIVPDEESTVTEIATQVEDGRLQDLVAAAEGLGPILLGRDLAGSLGVSAGDVVTVTSPQGRLSPMGVLPRMAKFRVVGVVRSGLYEFDAGWAWLPLASAQRLFDMGDTASLVEVKVDDMYAVRPIAGELLKALGDGYITTDWIQMNQSLFSALWLEKTAIAITIGLIVMVAALNIVATLILMVMEKHKDIAILVSMGASRGGVARIFMLQGAVIGAIGTLTGSLLGWGACQVLDHYKLIRVPQDVYQISYVPFALLPTDAAIVIAGALLTCFVATIYPARGAARLDPAEASVRVSGLIQASGVVKGYATAAGYVPVLQDLDLEVAEGEMLAILGASGVGKSTLLHVLGTLDRPEKGTVEVGGENVFTLPETPLRAFRNRTIGFVFQFHHLLPEFTALENVAMPLLIARRPASEAWSRASDLLGELGLAHRLKHRPGALSGGEQQRVAVARALAQSPRALLADEPTGNLDQETGDRLHELLRRLNQERKLTVVVVTHNERLAAACDRRLRLEAGKLRPLG